MKITKLFVVMMMLFSLIGCSGKEETKEQEDVVETALVEAPEDQDLEQLFKFKSVERTSITDYTENKMKEGLYSIGILDNDTSIFWYSSDDGYGYDDGVFLYVDKKITSSNIMEYAEKLNGNAISYEEFLSEYYINSDTIEKLNDYMKEDDYDKLIDFFNNNAQLLTETIYYQNGKIVNELSNGKATILQNNGIYVGNIKNGQRNGEGKQMGIYTGENSYTVASGTWKNDMLNGQATYYEPNIQVSSSQEEENVDFTYEGNFTDNYYDGTITATWKSDSGTYSGTFKANKGNIEIIREETGKYIYLDDGKGYYWYFTDATALNGWKVWSDDYSTTK